MAHEKTALRLGIGHEALYLPYNINRTAWRNPQSGKWESVEAAALGHFENDGWSGYSGEGGLILNLIKAMSFKKVPVRNRATYVEALYAQNVAFEEDRYDPSKLLSNVRRSTEKQVARNFDAMADRKTFRFQFGWGTSTTSTTMLDFFPGLERAHFLGLMRALGNDVIYEIAKVFATDPYEYRKGWPDLTIWQGRKVAFKEVKAPGDALRKSQRKIIGDILMPLNMDIAIVDVRTAET